MTDGNRLESLQRELEDIEAEPPEAEASEEEVPEEPEGEITREDIENRLPNRATFEPDGVLRAEVVSNHEANEARLTEKRKEILKYCNEHPLKTDRAVADAIGSAKTYVTSTKQDFRFLLRDDVLYEHFIEGDIEPEDTSEDVSDSEDEGLAPVTADEAIEAMEENVEETMEAIEASPFGEESDSELEFAEGYNPDADGQVISLTNDEGFDVIKGLIRGGDSETARNIFDKLVD